MEEQSQILLDDDDDNNKSFPCQQTLWVTQLGPNRFRLEQTPFMAPAGLHDIIEATPQEDGSFLFRGVLEKSKWKMYDFEGLKPIDSDAFMTMLVATVEEHGGICETVMGCFLAYLPSECDFDQRKEATRIAKILNVPNPWSSWKDFPSLPSP